jgi:ABC-type Fe3+ transport system permease subunit
MKKSTIEIFMSLVYVLFVFLLRGVYLYFDRDLTFFQALQKAFFELENLLIILVPGMLLAFGVIFVSSKIRQKKKKKDTNY